MDNGTIDSGHRLTTHSPAQVRSHLIVLTVTMVLIACIYPLLVKSATRAVKKRIVRLREKSGNLRKGVGGRHIERFL
jgi:hypothetical protein